MNWLNSLMNYVWVESNQFCSKQFKGTNFRETYFCGIYFYVFATKIRNELRENKEIG